MGILHQLCPRCGVGRLFRGSLWRGIPRMNERCPVCDLKYEREQGYFLGAMYISYALGVVVICLFAGTLWLLTRWSLEKAVLWGVFLFLPFAPSITLFSRVLWIYLDRAADPERDN
jgi:uncharacterized protein (DUF983 family)